MSSAEQVCKAVLAQAPETGGVWAVLTETALARGRLDAAIVSAGCGGRRARERSELRSVA
jgi:hypothetical protein